MRIVCIGAAPTSLGAAYRLNELIGERNKEAATTEIIILEKESIAGGLSGTVEKDGFCWDLGVHITYHEGQPYYEKAVRWAVEEWNQVTRNAMVDINYLYGEKGLHLVPYPAQFAVPLFPQKEKESCLRELKDRYERIQDSNKAPPANFSEWVDDQFGPTILRAFFEPYTRKVWSVEAKQMNHVWVGLRVAKLPQEKLEELCALDPEQIKNVDFGWGGNAKFCYPKKGGMGSVWKSMAAKLPNEWFRYNSKVVNVDHVAKTVIYENEVGERREEAYDVLLSTGPIDQLIRDTKLTTPINVACNKVIVVGVGLRKPIPPTLANFTWLYFPDETVPFFRLNIHSSFGDVTPDNDKYWSIMCESSRAIDDTCSEEEIRERVLEGLVRKSIIVMENVVSLWSITLPYGYPIPTIERDAELTRAHSELEKHSIFSRGRFGGWKYEVSNQDHCFIQGKEIVDRALFGVQEKMYKTGIIDSKQG
ncbi:hypothetical protein PFISCL1PPCAC_2997 [Pristionchus fissidentatus]|uniref:Amine oxidase domain-containing protein n=1 Tax=Pristionchus fissidentatus TaxID=1538716 RepID=A0AAV5V1L9_9BILA|nr:hypothetical protein PFISCL1PPCAC_2997 [Pristionchus fissidentatus]